jgi:1,4-dihydroxy-2-naphthoate octaprenyltransferase
MEQWRWWLRATRPKTLVLSLLPTATGIAWAWQDGAFSLWRAAVTLLCALLLQVLANYVNELGDYYRGADTPERVGPPRAVALGMISPEAMRRAAGAISVLVLGMGLVLVAHVGWWLLAVGLVALALAWLYTVGARPLAYIGLGELAAVVFFGIVPTAGAYAIMRDGSVSTKAVTSGIAFGAFAAAVLAINNIRDYRLDRQAGKRTLAVRFGTHAATRLVHILLAIPYVIALALSIQHPLVGSTVVTLPIAWNIARELPRTRDHGYNVLLGRTLMLATLYGILLAIAIVLRPSIPTPSG